MLGLKRIILPGFKYAKIGGIRQDLQPATQVQHEVDFADNDLQTEQKLQRLMQALDALNDRMAGAPCA